MHFALDALEVLVTREQREKENDRFLTLATCCFLHIYMYGNYGFHTPGYVPFFRVFSRE